VAIPVPDSDGIEGVLRARFEKAWELYSQDRTPENRKAYQRVFRQFGDWVLNGELPADL
jgi:hypothetical protein